MRSANLRFLSGNALKLIAAVSMLTDHIGYMFFPSVITYRILGRLAFPIFAFMIAEGCRYTKSKARYFFTIFSFSVIFQVVYYIVDGSMYFSIFVTFSLSILMIYVLQKLKEKVFAEKKKTAEITLWLTVFVLIIAVVALLNRLFTIDYGFLGCMTPVFASAFMGTHCKNEDRSPLDALPVHVLMSAVPLILLALESGHPQMYSLLAIPVLLLYSGKRGKMNLKYFFYVFYPVHLVILQFIDWFII